MRLFCSCEPKISNDAFDALVEEVMTTEPYASAQRVFWVVDNGTIHRGQKATDRLQGTWPNPMLVHPPRHASWLNQIEIYFSILARKAPTPCHFTDLDDLAARILGFQAQFAKTATPFSLDVHPPRPQRAARPPRSPRPAHTGRLNELP
jgi:hypothetical protein